MPPRNHHARLGPPLISEDLFKRLLVRERNRADRSNQTLAVVFVELPPATRTRSAPIWPAVVDAMAAAKRETDVVGWFHEQEALGLIVPEVPSSNPNFPHELNERFRGELERRLDAHAVGGLSIRLHIHPQPKGAEAEGVRPVDPVLTEARPSAARQTQNDAAKRVLDVAISLML